jgi:DNA-binding beta-propeller fold protein YncE
VVTDESQGIVAIVNLRSGQARSFIGVRGDPEYVAAEWGAALVASPRAGAVTVLGDRPLRVTQVLYGFTAPHIVEISPDGDHAYVTDDVRGTLSVIRLTDDRVTSIHVGSQAHHMASSPDQRRLWIALGESTRTIAIVDTSDPDRPRLVGSFDPGFPAHDLAFSPDGTQVWITSDRGRDVAVFRARDRRLLFRVPVGPPPQHVALAGAYAYSTSGYGSSVEQVVARTGRIVAHARAPYGSFEVDAGDGYVVTASLLDGQVALYTPGLRLLRTLHIGPGTRDIAISRQ